MAGFRGSVVAARIMLLQWRIRKRRANRLAAFFSAPDDAPLA